MRCTLRLGLVLLACLAAPVRADSTPAPLLTVAEKSAFKATAKHADVVAFCEQLAKRSSLPRLTALGTSHEKKSIPALILADPPVATPADAARTRKPVVLAVGNIHAGEVDGKEGLLMLAREIATGKART